MTSNKPQSALSSWYQEHSGRAVPFVLIVGAAVLVVLYLSGVVPEQFAALMLAAAIVAGACIYAFRHLVDASRTSTETALSLGLTVAVALVAGVPIVTTLIPGSPRAEGSVKAVGDTIPLPDGARGTVRILLHGRVGGAGTGDAQMVFGVGEEKLQGHFSRKPQNVRMGRRGRATVMREQNSQYLATVVPSNVDHLRVEEVHGSLAGPVEVQVFRDFLPQDLEIVLGALLLVFASALAARFGAGSAAPGALGLAMLFALMIHRIATPDIAIQPEMGSLVIGGVGGLVAGSVTTWICRKLISKRPEPQHSVTPQSA